MEPMWFELNPETIELQPTDLANWPASMDNSKMRMHEEGLETVIAFNLRSLFPDEDLLLVQTQKAISPEADIVAIDPLGTARVWS
jgi:hypothetical protein